MLTVMVAKPRWASACIRIRLAAQAIGTKKAIGIDLASACVPGSRRDPGDIFAPSDAVTEEAGEEGAEAPCSGSASGRLLLQWNLLAGRALVGGSQRCLPVVALSLCWAFTKPVSFVGGLVEGG